MRVHVGVKAMLWKDVLSFIHMVENTVQVFEKITSTPKIYVSVYFTRGNAGVEIDLPTLARNRVVIIIMACYPQNKLWTHK